MTDQSEAPFLENMDRVSALAISQLQLQENEQYAANMRALIRGHRGEMDEDLALRLDREYLQQQIASILQQQAADAANATSSGPRVNENARADDEAALAGTVAAISLGNGESSSVKNFSAFQSQFLSQ
jgi:hypothetical protein